MLARSRRVRLVWLSLALVPLLSGCALLPTGAADGGGAPEAVLTSLPEVVTTLEARKVPCLDPKYDDYALEGQKGSVICDSPSGTNFRVFVVTDWEALRTSLWGGRDNSPTCLAKSDFDPAILAKPVVLGSTYYVIADRGVAYEFADFPQSASAEVVADALGAELTNVEGFYEFLDIFCNQ